MQNLTKIIAQNVKTLRLERDLTISALATKSFLSEDLISEIEEGIYRPDSAELLRLAEVFQIPPSHLLSMS
ncbi:helix-turn-helix domain-containing protein [Gluconobacter morbifer]|uniref:helix-turn-helix domain-containing protein n=1 Tax=Gluconobacter morbifer TaxID=479935 RepID=UPI000A070E6E|nr:helix-turn-helix transcriptional regulator [Gluconobacter morbifer]